LGTFFKETVAFADEMMAYVRSLEQRVKTLEEEKRVLEQKLVIGRQGQPGTDNGFVLDSPMWDPSEPSPRPDASRPEAVVQALQVLEVREQVEGAAPAPGSASRGPHGPAGMDDGERALVREMCNVVWRKLEDSPVCGSAGMLGPLGPLSRR